MTTTKRNNHRQHYLPHHVHNINNDITITTTIMEIGDFNNKKTTMAMKISAKEN